MLFVEALGVLDALEVVEPADAADVVLAPVPLFAGESAASIRGDGEADGGSGCASASLPREELLAAAGASEEEDAAAVVGLAPPNLPRKESFERSARAASRTCLKRFFGQDPALSLFALVTSARASSLLWSDA